MTGAHVRRLLPPIELLFGRPTKMVELVHPGTPMKKSILLLIFKYNTKNKRAQRKNSNAAKY